MLETFVNQRGIYYVIMALCVLGAIGKLYESRIYGKLLVAAENPERTEHPFMKQLKLKYKNCYKLEYKIHNIDAFIETSLFKYKDRFFGLERLHTINSRIMLLCILASCVGVALCVYYKINARALMYHILAGAMAVAGLEFVEQQFGVELKRRVLFTTLKDYLENVLANHLENRGKESLDDLDKQTDLKQLANEPKKVKAKGKDRGENIEKQIAASKHVTVQETSDEGYKLSEELEKKIGERLAKSSKAIAQEKVIAEVIKEFFP